MKAVARTADNHGDARSAKDTGEYEGGALRVESRRVRAQPFRRRISSVSAGTTLNTSPMIV